jgi:citrate lyase subunit beta/citryl-CoA lyase
MMTILRSLLFVPGNIPRMLDRAIGLRPDAFVPDMEDSVPWDEKANARGVTAAYIPELAATGVPVIPRVNSLDTGLLEDDLSAVTGPHVYGVSVGKMDNPEIVAEVASVLDRAESEAGVESGAIRLVPWIESAEAIVNAYDICKSSDRIVAVALGAEDFTNDMEIKRTDGDSELAYARGAIAVAARAAGVLALDTPFFAFRDPVALKANSEMSRAIGFKGRFAIHPAQLDIINGVYSPSEDEVAQARREIEAFEEAVAMGRGSTSLDGKVIDVPVVKRAQALLDRAKAMGLTVVDSE